MRPTEDTPTADPTSADRSRFQPVPLVPSADRPRLGTPLPGPLTSFVGREREVAEVVALLRADARLVTLLGPGGVGKTRLALQAATELATAFADGVAFVDLAPLSDLDLVLPTVAQALGVRDVGDRPLPDRLADALQARTLLLVLDNFEHVVSAAPLLAHLLESCPRLAVLSTSRAPLRLSGEQVFPVPPLALPVGYESPERLAEVGSVRLFVERARAADPAFAMDVENATAVAAICRRLDGLPLAVELAAAKVRVLPPPALLPRLERALPLLGGGARDAPARQQTVRDAIAWSHDLLVPEEQSLFRRLAVFVGGFTLGAAEVVAGYAELSTVDVLAGVEALEAHSLIRRLDTAVGEPRYGMLETVREFGLEQLETSGEAGAVRRAHAEHVCAFAEAAASELNGMAPPHWLDRMEQDLGNFRAALTWAIEHEEPITGLRLACALRWFWIQPYQPVRVREAAGWLEQLLEMDGTVPTTLRADALTLMADLSLGMGDYQRGLVCADGGLALARQAADPVTEGMALYVRGSLAVVVGDYERGTYLLEEALAVWRALEQPYWIASILHELGDTAVRQGDLRRSRELFEEALSIWRDLGNLTQIAWDLHYLAAVELDDGESVRAARHWQESLALSKELRLTWNIASIARDGAGLAEIQGDPGRAARMISAAQRVRVSIGLPVVWPQDRTYYAVVIDRLTERLGDEAFAAAWAEGEGMAIDDLIAETELVLATPVPAQQAPDPARGTGLTPRELEVLRLLAEGLTNRGVAEALFNSRRTVDNHVSNLRAKLDAATSREAVAKARRLGILA